VAKSWFEKIDPKTLKWRTRPFEAPKSIWEADDKLQVGSVMTPVEYFCTFFDIKVIDMMINQTNLYGLQCTGDLIKRYIGILLYLEVIKDPQLKMAWSKELKLTATSDSMPRGRFEIQSS